MRTKFRDNPPAAGPQARRRACDYRTALVRALRIRSLLEAGFAHDTAVEVLEALASDSPALTLHEFLGALALHRALTGTPGYAFRFPTEGGNGEGTR